MLKLLLNHWQEHKKKPSSVLTEDPLYSSNISNTSNIKEFYSVSRVNPIYEDSEGSELAVRASSNNDKQKCVQEANFESKLKSSEKEISTSSSPSPNSLHKITATSAEVHSAPNFFNRKLSLPFPEDFQVDANSVEVSSSEFAPLETKDSFQEDKSSILESDNLVSGQNKVNEDFTKIENEQVGHSNNRSSLYDNPGQKYVKDLSRDNQELPDNGIIQSSSPKTDHSDSCDLDSQQPIIKSLDESEKISVVGTKSPSVNNVLPKVQDSLPSSNIYTEETENLNTNKEVKVMSFLHAYLEKVRESQEPKAREIPTGKEQSSTNKKYSIKDNEFSFSKKIGNIDSSGMSVLQELKKLQKEFKEINSHEKEGNSGGILRNKPENPSDEKLEGIHRYKKSPNKANKSNTEVKSTLDIQENQPSTSQVGNQLVNKGLVPDPSLNKDQSAISKQKPETDSRNHNGSKITQIAEVNDCLEGCPVCEPQKQQIPLQTNRQSSSESSGVTRGDQVSTDSLDPIVLLANNSNHQQTRVDSSQEDDYFPSKNHFFRQRLTPKLCKNCISQWRSERFNKKYEDYYKSVQDSVTRMRPDGSESCDQCQNATNTSFCRHCHRERHSSLKSTYRHNIPKSPLKGAKFSHMRSSHHLGTRHSPEGSAQNSSREKIENNVMPNVSSRSIGTQHQPYRRSSTLPCTCENCRFGNSYRTQSLDDISRVSLRGQLWNPVHSSCTCALDIDHRRRVTFAEDSAEDQNFHFVNTESHQGNLIRPGTPIEEESSLEHNESVHALKMEVLHSC
ncbi:uncharacterized protein LOC143240111 [Tachypleus tridentatus]|uniref:uncharacterized protein LOC143240111 n=1 Tax=Tachypleus tridentatus TaxID=6853 RepID=UPI003FD070BE